LTSLSSRSNKSVKTCDDVNIQLEVNNLADFLNQSFNGFDWILGYSRVFRRFD